VIRLLCLCLALASAPTAWAQTTQRDERDSNRDTETSTTGRDNRTTNRTDPNDSSVSGPVRLRNQGPLPNNRDRSDRTGRTQTMQDGMFFPLPYQPGEFEQFVQRQAGPEIEIRRFGAELMTPEIDRLQQRDVVDFAPLVPADYLVRSGDEIVVTLWGSVDADLRLVVDRSGRIAIPRVGPVLVAGVRYADLPAVISQRVAQVFRNFQVSAAMGQLRGQRVYVTGFVARPGC
jgi:hypothetical protein